MITIKVKDLELTLDEAFGLNHKSKAAGGLIKDGVIYYV